MLVVFTGRGGRSLARGKWVLRALCVGVIWSLFVPAPIEGYGVLAAPQATGNDWPMLGHDLARTGATPDQVDNPGSWRDMPTLWVRDFASFDNTGSNEGSERIGSHVQPIVVAGVVYVPTLSNRLYALDAETGETLWVFDAGAPGTMPHSPAVVGGTVYVGSTNGRFYAVDAATGREVWFFQGGEGGFDASPAVIADTVYVGGRDGVFYALRTADGTPRWAYDVGAPVVNSAAVDEAGGRVYFGAEDMHVYALRLTGGSLVWRSERLYGRSFGHYYPVLVGGTLFIRTNPAVEMNEVLGEGDNVILQAAGVQNVADKRAICGQDPLNIHAPWTQSGWNAEVNAIRQFLIDHPEYRTWYALDVTDGHQRYMVPILWSQGIGYVGQPPVVRDANHVIAYVRSYYSNYDQCNSWYLFGGFAEIEVSTGNLRILNLAQEPGGTALWTYGIGTIGDEDNMLTLGGDVLYVSSHGDCIGGVDLSSGAGVRGMIARDQPWYMRESNEPLMGHVSKPGTGFAGAVPYGDRLYWVTADRVGALGEPGTVSDPWTPPSLGQEPGDPVRFVQAPSLSALEPYVLNVPQFNVDWAATADLRAELEEQVSELMATRYAPFLFLPGKSVIRFYFQDPAELFYTLSIALPYLSPTLQAQVEGYLAQEWQQYNPLITRCYPLDQGERRELHYIGPNALAIASGESAYFSTPDRLEILYAVWSYAYFADRWDVVADNWSLIKGMVTSAIDPGNPATLLSEAYLPFLGSVNRRTSTLIAYTRMAQHVGDTAAFNWGLDAATRSLAARIEHEETDRPAIGEWRAASTEGGKFVYRRGTHFTWIPRYRDLTPEIAAALQDYAATDLSDQAEYLRVVRPAWYVAWGPQNFEGEVSTNFPQHAIDIFAAQAMMLGASPDQLRLYLDRPWCRGDLYYVQKLVYAIRAQSAVVGKRVSRASVSQGDVVTYTVTTVGTGAPMTVTDRLPAALSYVEGSAGTTPAVGTLTFTDVPSGPLTLTELTWQGTLTEATVLNISYAVTVSVAGPLAVVNTAVVDDGSAVFDYSAVVVVDGRKIYLPLVLRRGQ